MNTAADPRYLQVARALRQEIVDGVYPVGSQLPTEHALCDRFSVSRYTVREALRRLREDNLISSKPRSGTMVVPRTSTSSYAQDVMSIDDLMAFASGAQLVIQASRMLTVDADLAQRTGLAAGQEWLGIGGYRQRIDLHNYSEQQRPSRRNRGDGRGQFSCHTDQCDSDKCRDCRWSDFDVHISTRRGVERRAE